MIEIRFHGRGGQGAVIASNILADAAFREGMEVQAFPYFGVERRGAPVTAFTRLDTKPIRIRSEIKEPNIVVVLDESLLSAVNVTSGLKPDGLVLINTPKKPEDFKHLKAKIATVDAKTIAVNNRLGSKTAPIVNTAILGAFAKATGLVKLETVMECAKDGTPVKKDENANAVKEAYEQTKM
ncbi:MAG: 2-oxoacid:acceptor oxidoreductase family protein [Thermoplasmata archaeon]